MYNIIQSLPANNDRYYIEHENGSNTSKIKEDLLQNEKDDLFQVTLNADKKLDISKNKADQTKLKHKNSSCLKNKDFLGLYRELENENELYFDEKKQEATAAAYIPFVEQQKNIARPSTLYSFKGPFVLLHADIADIRFLAKSIVDLKYCIVFVDLSKIDTYPMKHRRLLRRKIELFYNKNVKERKMDEKMSVNRSRIWVKRN